MIGKQYKKAIAALGLTHATASELLGVDLRTSKRWASGERPVPWSTAMLLELMTNKHLELEFTFPASAERRLWRFQAEQSVRTL
jgi:hypothetical protein